MTYIKILYNGYTYGPLTSPQTLSQISSLFRIPATSRPSLSTLTAPVHKILRRDTQLSSGVYELQVDLNGQPEELLEEPKVRPSSSTVCTQTAPITRRSNQDPPSSSIPLSKPEMEKIVNSMLRLLASIPPRYVKHNKVLSSQIDAALTRVDNWLEHAETLYSSDGMHVAGVSKPTFLAFVQYRVLDLMHGVWKRVWMRFGPALSGEDARRVGSVEQVMDTFGIWRKGLEEISWEKIRKHVGEKGNQTAKDRLMKPLPIPRNEDAGNLVRLTQGIPDLTAHNDAESLARFRIEFVRAIREECLYKNDDLKRVMEYMLEEKEEVRGYPTRFVRHAIELEFAENREAQKIIL